MVSTLLILTLAACALVAVATLSLRNLQQEKFTLDKWEEKKHDVDVDIFRAMLDATQEHYLAVSLSHYQFAVFQRRRIAIALRMLHLVNEDIYMLLKLGARAKIHDDPTVVSEADRFIASALQLRLSLRLAKYALWLKWMFPYWTLAVPSVYKPYQQVLDSFWHVQQYSCQR